jgi:uncharacterized protein YraI
MENMKNRKSFLIVVLSLLLVALLLAACSSGDATEAPAEPAAPEGESAPEEEVVEPSPEPVDVLPTAAPGEATLTAKENVRVRSGPSQAYPIYAKMDGGQTAKLQGISADGTYYAVEMPIIAPRTGWVDANFVEVGDASDLPVIEAPPVPPSADFVGPQPGDPTLIAAEAVFVRSGPGEQYPAYGIAEADTRGLAVGESEDGAWWAVRINPEVVGLGYGWVQKEFVTTENVGDELTVIKTPPVPTAGQLPPPDPNGPYGMANDYVNVRSGPGTNYPVLVVAAPDAAAEISGKSADGVWWQVKVSSDLIESGLAWVHAAYVNVFNIGSVSVVEGPPAPPANPAPAYSCVLISQSPVDGTVMDAGETFDMSWEIQNIGETTWSLADTVITKVTATLDQPLSEIDILTLESDVIPGGTYQVIVPMQAPDFAGEFGEYWIVTQGGSTVCDFYNVIEVQE